jgi:hypothetical protein
VRGSYVLSDLATHRRSSAVSNGGHWIPYGKRPWTYHGVSKARWIAGTHGALEPVQGAHDRFQRIGTATFAFRGDQCVNDISGLVVRQVRGKARSRVASLWTAHAG